MLMIKDTIRKVVSMQDLAPEEARDLMTSIADGNVTDAQIGSILTALSMKGVTAHEITAFAHVLRDRAVRVKTDTSGTFVDTCGTGGDGAHTFNISTPQPSLQQQQSSELSSTGIGECQADQDRQMCSRPLEFQSP